MTMTGLAALYIELSYHRMHADGGDMHQCPHWLRHAQDS